MNILLSVTVFLSGTLLISAQGYIGSVVYQTARGAGKVTPIYGLDPLDPTYPVNGENRALYARREPLYGDGYWAELWAGPTSATEGGLVPVPRSLVHFRNDVSAIRGINNLHIPGTLGGDDETFQLRVWAVTSLSGKEVNSWAEVLQTDDVPRGKSALTHVILGNVSQDRHLFLPQNLAFSLEGFGLYIVPEPHPLAILLLFAALAGRTLLYAKPKASRAVAER